MLDPTHRLARADAVCVLVGKRNHVALRIFIITKQAQKVNKNRLELCPRRKRTRSYSFLGWKLSNNVRPHCHPKPLDKEAEKWYTVNRKTLGKDLTV